MNVSANLSEFTTQQLQVLLNVVVSKIMDLKRNRDSWEGYFCGNLSVSYEANAPELVKEYETLQLFRVQILNAIVEVKLREEVQSN